MGERKIFLNNGTVFDNSNCGLADGYLWCWIKGSTLEEVVPLFFNPENTKTIKYQIGTTFASYIGYTSVRFTRRDSDGCSICMTKPVSEDVIYETN